MEFGHTGTLPIGKGQCKFIIIAVDYFTNWAEAEPLATITEQKIRNFVWQAIVCRFGIPRALVSNNGKQFDNASSGIFVLSSELRIITRPQRIRSLMGRLKSPSKPLRQH